MRRLQRNAMAACVGLVILLTGGGLPAAEGPETFKVGEFTFKRPAAWQWIASSSPMRAAQLQVLNPSEGEPVEVVFFFFGPNNGGGTEANVERWLGQFKEPKAELKPKVEEIKVGSRNLTMVEAQGTYLSGSPLGAKTPKPGFALAGAILESKGGNVFVKMTGPAAQTKAALPAFRNMVTEALK